MWKMTGNHWNNGGLGHLRTKRKLQDYYTIEHQAVVNDSGRTDDTARRPPTNSRNLLEKNEQKTLSLVVSTTTGHSLFYALVTPILHFVASSTHKFYSDWSNRSASPSQQ